MLPPARQRGLDKLEDPTKLYAIQIKTNRTNWRNAVALTWTAAGEEPARVSLDSQGEIWTFRTGDRSVRLKWDGSPPEVRR
jgi:hypothetical protein